MSREGGGDHIRAVLTSVRRWGVLVLALAVLGGQSTALQLLAWAGMLAARSPDLGFAMAVRTTFDGQHPCGVCAFVAALADAEQAPAPPRPEKPDAKPAKAAPFDLPEAMRLIIADRHERIAWGATDADFVAQHAPGPEPRPPQGDTVG